MKTFYGLMAALLIGIAVGVYITKDFDDAQATSASQQDIGDAIAAAKQAKKMEGKPNND